MADSGVAYDVSGFPTDLWKRVPSVEIYEQASSTEAWKEADDLAYFEAPILSSITTDVGGGGGVTVDGSRFNPLCPRANP